MLVLTRQPGEKIAIGDDIQIETLLVEGGQVRLAIRAPHHMAITRSELLQRHPMEAARQSE